MKMTKKIKGVLSAFGVIGGLKLSILHLMNKKNFKIKMKDYVKIWLKEIQDCIYIRPYTSDIVLLIGMLCNQDVEGRHEYEINWENKVGSPDNIIDAGANIGIFSMMYAKKFPNARIIAFEPEESNFELLLKNTQKFKNIVCVKAGIWCRDAYLKIIPRDTGKWGFYVQEIDSKGENLLGGV